ncbi:MAG: hypothetical protein AUH85_15275 [Chloroflexi bacterium 13_1_40CM_4_68_4]|nr:MAG: hypothetical protein AUH85_15275 [Chloroflexi bacterium 13_1_40CM_4_68_4]
MSGDSFAALRAYAFELVGMAKTGSSLSATTPTAIDSSARIAEKIVAMTFPNGIRQGAEYPAELGAVTSQ